MVPCTSTLALSSPWATFCRLIVHLFDSRLDRCYIDFSLIYDAVKYSSRSTGINIVQLGSLRNLSSAAIYPAVSREKFESCSLDLWLSDRVSQCQISVGRTLRVLRILEKKRKNCMEMEFCGIKEITHSRSVFIRTSRVHGIWKIRLLVPFLRNFFYTFYNYILLFNFISDSDYCYPAYEMKEGNKESLPIRRIGDKNFKRRYFSRNDSCETL